LPRKELDDLKEQLDRVHKDNDRIRLVRRVGINYSVSCAELKELTQVMRYGQAAIDTVVMMYVKLRDKEGIDDIINSFQYEEDKQQIRTKLGLPK
jgi:hypothetical protein